MSTEAQFFFYLVAFVAFAVAVVLSAAEISYARLNLVAGGLAAWVFVLLYTTLKAL